MYYAIVTGGYTCGITVAQLGGSVRLIEKNGLGGLVPNEDAFLIASSFCWRCHQKSKQCKEGWIRYAHRFGL
jgi:hypothetical protein